MSYAEEMVSQRMVTRLANPEHQAKILSEAQDLDNLTKKVERIVSLETTDEAADKIRTPSSAEAGAIKFSQSRRSQRAQIKRDRSPRSPSPRDRGGRVRDNSFRSNRFKTNRAHKCRGCGNTDHGAGKMMTREDCPAFGKRCNSCGKDNHFASVCEQRKSRASFACTDDDTSPEETSADESDRHEADA